MATVHITANNRYWEHVSTEECLNEHKTSAVFTGLLGHLIEYHCINASYQGFTIKKVRKHGYLTHVEEKS